MIGAFLSAEKVVTMTFIVNHIRRNGPSDSCRKSEGQKVVRLNHSYKNTHSYTNTHKTSSGEVGEILHHT